MYTSSILVWLAIQIKEHLYKQLLLPSIEYCSAIWDPYHQTTVSKLEMIQHRAARFVLNKPWHRSSQQHSITDMLNYLQWPSLKSRRRNVRLILLFKIVRNLLVLPNHCLPQPTPVSYTHASNLHSCNPELIYISILFCREQLLIGIT